MLPNRPLVLCVDDDPDDQQMFLDALMALNPGLHVASVSNGEEALRFLQTAKEQDNLPALVLLDINMPLMDGRQTLAYIKADPVLGGMPVVLFTTSSSNTDQSFARQHSVELVTKPSSCRALHGSLEQVLRRYLV